MAYLQHLFPPQLTRRINPLETYIPFIVFSYTFHRSVFPLAIFPFQSSESRERIPPAPNQICGMKTLVEIMAAHGEREYIPR